MSDTFVEKIRYEADISDLQDKLDRVVRKQDDVEGKTSKATDRMGSAWSKLKGSIGGISSVLGTLSLGVVGVGGAAALMVPKILDAGAGLEALDQKSATVFEGSLASVKEWADANAAAMGMTETQAIAAAAGMADLLKPMGFTADQAADMSTELADLSGALSAWTGGTRSATEVNDILSAALLGERDALKSLGISISEADVQAQLAKKGQEGLTGAALEQAKAQATLELILGKSTDAQKAWADGSMSAIQQQNQSKASIEELKEAFNRGLYPILQGLVPVATEVATWLAEHLPGAIATAKKWFDEELRPTIERVVEWVREHWPEIRVAIEETLTKVRDGIAGFIQFVKDVWEQWGDEIIAIVEFVWPYIETYIGGVIENIRAVIKTVTSLLKGDWDGAWQGIKDIVSNVWDTMLGLVDIAIGDLKDGVKAGVDWIWEQIKAMPGKLLDLHVEFAKAGANLAGSIVDGIADGIGDMLSRATEVAKDFANAIIGFVNRNVIDKVNDLLEFKIAVRGAPDISINPPDLPRLRTFHSGGTVPGLLGQEVPVLALAGETIRTRAQEDELQRRLEQQAALLSVGRQIHIEHLHVESMDAPRQWFDEGLWRVAA